MASKHPLFTGRSLGGAVARTPWPTRTVTAVMAALALGVVVSPRAQAAAPSPVPTTVVGTGAHTATLDIEGSLQAVQQSTVAAQVGGNVLQLAVKAGDRVKAGALLARIDDRDLQARSPEEALRLRAQRLWVVRAGAVVSRMAPATAELALPGRPPRVDFTRHLPTSGAGGRR